MFASLTSRAINSIRSPFAHRIHFLHIPKCGGTSLRHAMRAPYLTLDVRRDQQLVHLNAGPVFQVEKMLEPVTGTNPSVRPPEHLLLYFMARTDTRFIDGHVPFSQTAYANFRDRFAYVSLVRNPADRWISEYAYNKFHAGTHMRELATMNIEDYIDTGFGRSQGNQYVLYLGGRRMDLEYRSRAAIQNAIDNVERFAVIGCLEQMDDFRSQFLARFGWQLQLSKRNESPSPKGFVEEVVSSDIRRKIEALCEPDYEVYEAVRQRVGTREQRTPTVRKAQRAVGADC